MHATQKREVCSFLLYLLVREENRKGKWMDENAQPGRSPPLVLFDVGREERGEMEVSK